MPDPNVTPEPATPPVPNPVPNPNPEPAPDWRSTLDPAIKDHASLKDFKDPQSLAKSYVEAQKLIGVDKIPIPQNFDSPEVRGKFFNDVFDRLGRPKEAKEYKITDVKLPDGVSFKTEPETMDNLKAEAHKLGILPFQLDGLYKWYATDSANKLLAQNQELTKSRQDSESSLRNEWGAAYPAKVSKAKELLTKFAGDDYKQLLDSGFGNNPAVIRFMAKMAESISEDAFAKGGGEVTMTPEEARKELNKVRLQLVNMQQSNPEYKDLLKRRNDLIKMVGDSR